MFLCTKNNKEQKNDITLLIIKRTHYDFANILIETNSCRGSSSGNCGDNDNYM